MTQIPLSHLALALLPVLVTGWLHWRWCHDRTTTLHATARMVIQLLLIGYLLTALLTEEQLWPVIATLTVMLFASSWIAMRPLIQRQRDQFVDMLTAIAASALLSIALVVGLVLTPEPWFNPAITIPIAGMAFSNAMNAVSLAAERYQSERINHADNPSALRAAAFQAAMLPQYNTLFAVGLVALPGMMTGQILSGISPLIAVRYQIVIMAMVVGGSGIAAGLYLTLRLRRDG